jgi:hypothetical protein
LSKKIAKVVVFCRSESGREFRNREIGRCERSGRKARYPGGDDTLQEGIIAVQDRKAKKERE